MLTVLCYVHSLRFAIPAAAMLGVVPQYLLTWGAWRLLSAVLPRRVYERGDEFLYSSYQSMVSFFFETYTGAEVSLKTFCYCRFLVRSDVGIKYTSKNKNLCRLWKHIGALRRKKMTVQKTRFEII